MNTPAIRRETPDKADVRALLAASDRYHAALYPDESNHLVDVTTLSESHVRFLVARLDDGRAVGCGAVVLGDDGGLKAAELKRMWVDPTERGTGLGRRLLVALEAVAKEEGAEVVRLETGISQTEALALYRSVGYLERGPFAPYSLDPLSLFMEKPLVRDRP